VAALLRQPVLKGATLVVDETGIGTAVTDMLTARRVATQRVTITGGTAVTRNGGNHWHVAKQALVNAVEVVLDGRRLTVPTVLPLAETLVAELDNFRVKKTPLGADTFGAGGEWREGAHDDLVLAVALAVWAGETLPSGQVRVVTY
jgi:hypothetical protein